MDIRENIKDTIKKGYEEATQKLNNAANTVREMGAKGQLEFEILQLGNKIQNKMPVLGSEVYDLFHDGDLGKITKVESILKLLNDIQALEKKLESKKEEFNQYK